MASTGINNCESLFLSMVVTLLSTTVRGFPASVQETSVASSANLTEERIRFMEHAMMTDDLQTRNYKCQVSSRGELFYYINGCARCDDTDIDEGIKWPDCSVYRNSIGKNSEGLAPVNNASGPDLGNVAFGLVLAMILAIFCYFCYRKCSCKKTPGPSVSEDKNGSTMLEI